MSPKEDFKKLLGTVAGIAAIGTAFLKRDSREESLATVANQMPSIPEIPPYGLPVPEIEVQSYQVRESPYSGTVIIVGNHYTGSIFDSPVFQESIERFGNWMDKRRIEIARTLEDIVIETRKHLGPRHFSGADPHDHIRKDFEASLRSAIKANAVPDAVSTYVIEGHDVVEDDKNILDGHNEWEKALMDGNEPLREKIERELLLYRRQKVSDVKDKLFWVVDKMQINGLKRELKDEIEDAAAIIRDETRHPQERPYALSMAFQLNRKPNERIIQVARRMHTKGGGDRVGNNMDYKPVLDYDKMQTLVALYDDKSPLGQYLREKYGSAKMGIYMPPVVRVGNAFNTLFVLHFFNQTRNNIDALVNRGTREAEWLKLLDFDRAAMIESALELLRSAGANYELLMHPREINDVNERIEQKKRTNFYNAITPDGNVIEWLGYDVGGRKVIESLDFNLQTRGEVYSLARDLEVVIEMFGKFYKKEHRDEYGRPVLVTDPNVKYDPKVHQWFTLDGVDDILNMLQGENYRHLYRRQLFERRKLGVNGVNGSTQLTLNF